MREYRARNRDSAKAYMRTYNRAYYTRNKERIKAKVRTYAQENKEKLRAYNRAYREEHLDQVKAKTRAWYFRNRAKVLAYQKAYAAAHREKLASYFRSRMGSDPKHPEDRLRPEVIRRREQLRKATLAWALENPDKIKAYKVASEGTRRARKRGAYIEEVDPRTLYDMSLGICGICGKALKYEDMSIDHIIPLSKGGSHSYANTQAVHRICNTKKGTRLLRRGERA